jgi:hypothetical protein
MIVFGGREASGTQYFNDLYRLDLANMIWTRIAATVEMKTGLPPLAYHTATLYDDKLLVFGGLAHGTHVQNECYVFETTSNSWRQLECENPYSPPARYKHTCALVGNRLFIYGGLAGPEIVLDDMWQLALPWPSSGSSPERRLSFSPSKIPPSQRFAAPMASEVAVTVEELAHFRSELTLLTKRLEDAQQRESIAWGRNCDSLTLNELVELEELHFQALALIRAARNSQLGKLKQ